MKINSTRNAARAAHAYRGSKPSIQIAGTIQAGVKVLTAAAEKITGAKEAYAEGLEAGATFDMITSRLASLKGMPRNPLRPINVDYYSMQQDRISIPGAAAKILELHGEDRGNGMRVYNLPIVFPTNDIDLCFDESFEQYAGARRVRWSQQVGDQLFCMERGEVEAKKGRKRRWKGAGENQVGACDPVNCQHFEAGQCQHRGRLRFWIPGVNSSGVFELRFNSIQAKMQIFEKLETVQRAIGTIAGLQENGEPMFTLTKVHKEGKFTDWETGKEQTAKQWIITLEDNIDVLGYQDRPQLAAPDDIHQLEGPTSPAPLEQSHMRGDRGNHVTANVEKETLAVVNEVTGEVSDSVDQETGEIDIRSAILAEQQRLGWKWGYIANYIVVDFLKMTMPATEEEQKDVFVGEDGIFNNVELGLRVVEHLKTLEADSPI